MSRLSLIIIVFLVICLPYASASKYDDVIAQINNLLDKYPTYLQLIDIGKNDQNETIYGLRVENPNYQMAEGKKCNHLLVGVHHGNEGTTADLSLLFVEKLIAKFNNQNCKEYKGLSDSIYYVIPVLNISGYNANNRRERDKNGNYLDPNRDYPDPCVHNSYFQLASINNLVAFVERYHIVGAITAHGYIGTFTYPWGIYTSNTKTQDDSFYKYLGQESIKANNYRTGTHTDVIYPASGAFEDWAYHKHGIWTMLMELKRYNNMEKDVECMLICFSLLPDQRSTQHQHTGNCTSYRAEGSRP